jgi:hypothetical protein
MSNLQFDTIDFKEGSRANNQKILSGREHQAYNVLVSFAELSTVSKRAGKAASGSPNAAFAKSSAGLSGVAGVCCPSNTEAGWSSMSEVRLIVASDAMACEL